MPFVSLPDLAALKTGRTRLMGLDVGDKTIGVSLSDWTWQIAQPHTLIRRRTPAVDCQQIDTLFTTEAGVALVIGLPLTMSGTPGPQADKVTAFARHCADKIACPILLWDERLSTVAVSRDLRATTMTHRQRAQVVDKRAAAFILQGVLDALRHAALKDSGITALNPNDG